MTNESWFIRDTTLAIDVSLGDSSENEINLNLVLRSLHGIIDAQFHKLFFFLKICDAIYIFLCTYIWGIQTKLAWAWRNSRTGSDVGDQVFGPLQKKAIKV